MLKKSGIVKVLVIIAWSCTGHIRQGLDNKSTVVMYLYRAGGAGPTTSTLVGPKISSFMVKALYFQGSGQTSNCRIKALFK